ncbi:hypothetical protein [Porphyromonas somerae]|uniref:hypothetical protein n=1 Tax=Porphyromonas somerae TaxID=322095 RepID=UPI002A7FDB56|nr:hypothetical protein [Porphyromonas somerae]MDY3883816.1 hypothetical protein [Porphyromonas somerae]
MMIRRVRMKIGAMKFGLRLVRWLALVCFLLNCLVWSGYTIAIAQITDFNREGLDSDCRLTFSGEGSRYAFDSGSEDWYKNAVKLDSYYKPLDKNGYIAPWKLIPVSEKDVVKVRCSDSLVDATTVRFVSENGDIVLAKYGKAKHEWRLELPSVGAGYRGFYNASNVIDIIPYYNEESNYPFNKAIFAYKQKGCEELAQLYVKEQRDIKNAISQRYGQDRRSPIEIAKMQDLIHLAAKREQLQLLEQLSNQVSLSDFEPWAVSSPIEYKEEFIEQINKNGHKNYEAYLSLYAYEDLRAQLHYSKVGGFDFDQEATFTDKTDWWLSSYVDKPVYNTLDLASVVLGVFSLDVIPDALNLGYSLVRRDYDNAIGSGLSLLIIGPTGYASKTTIPRGLKYLRRSENGLVIAVDNSDEELRSIIRKSKNAFEPSELDNLDNASRDELWRLANRENLFENLDKWLNEVPQNVRDIIRGWDNDYKLLLNKDLSSNSTGAELNSLLASAENVEIWKYLKDDPAYAFELAKDNKDWERWSKINFFKDITKRGREFETLVLNRIKTRSGEEYNALKALVPDLDDRKLLNQIQFCLPGFSSPCSEKGQFFIADQVWIKYDERERVVDMVIVDVKLSEGTAFTHGQTIAKQNEGNVALTYKPIVPKATDINNNKLPHIINQGDMLPLKKLYKIYGDGDGKFIGIK